MCLGTGYWPGAQSHQWQFLSGIQWLCKSVIRDLFWLSFFTSVCLMLAANKNCCYDMNSYIMYLTYVSLLSWNHSMKQKTVESTAWRLQWLKHAWQDFCGVTLQEEWSTSGVWKICDFLQISWLYWKQCYTHSGLELLLMSVLKQYVVEKYTVSQ